MYDVGRLCVKLAGRDAGKKCVIVETDGKTALIDGQTRRRKVNVSHLEPLETTVKIKKGASNAEVTKALTALKIEVRTTKPKKTPARPKKARKAAEKPENVTKKAAKKSEKKADPKEETKPKKAVKKSTKKE